MRYTTIGSGTGAPSATRVSSAHLVEAGSCRILFDCGSGAVHRMAALGLDWLGITHVFVTHFHADHISDIPTLLFAWRYGAIPWRSEPARLIGPPGFAKLVADLDAAFGGKFASLDFQLDLVELSPGGELNLDNGVTVASIGVPHTPESVAYSVRHGGKRIVYSGDTALAPDVAVWAKHCDLLVMECSLPTAMAVPSHLTPEQCATMAGIAQPAALALTHFYAPVESEDVRAIVASQYSGPLYMTHDGWTIQLGD